jgi:nicotinamidase-related amidase
VSPDTDTTSQPAAVLDPNRTAVVVLDLQVDVIAPEGKLSGTGAAQYVQRHDVLQHVAALLAGARVRGVPVVHVHQVHTPGHVDLSCNTPIFQDIVERDALVRGTPGAEPVPEAAPQPGDIVIEKQRVNGFHDTSLDVELRGLGVDTIVVSGAWTNFSVEHTARHAVDAGYRVVIATDATATRDEIWQRAALDHVLSAMAEQLLVDDVLDALDE